jgi:hypothetical protein
MKNETKPDAPAEKPARNPRLAGIELVVNAAIEKHAENAAHYVGLATVSGNYDNAANFAEKAAAEYHKAAGLATLRVNLLALLDGRAA